MQRLSYNVGACSYTIIEASKQERARTRTPSYSYMNVRKHLYRGKYFFMASYRWICVDSAGYSPSAGHQTRD